MLPPKKKILKVQTYKKSLFPLFLIRAKYMPITRNPPKSPFTKGGLSMVYPSGIGDAEMFPSLSKWGRGISFGQYGFNRQTIMPVAD